jgi:hypothetical protein
MKTFFLANEKIIIKELVVAMRREQPVLIILIQSVQMGVHVPPKRIVSSYTLLRSIA